MWRSRKVHFWSHWPWHPGHCHGQITWVCHFWLMKFNNNQYISIAINNHPLVPYSRLSHNYDKTDTHSPPDSAPSCVSCGVTSHEQLYLTYIVLAQSPYFTFLLLSCGLGGGNWSNKYMHIIRNTFQTLTLNVTKFTKTIWVQNCEKPYN